MKTIKREQIIQVLKERGFNVCPNDVVKNGVVKKGINILNNTNIAPVIYTEELIAHFDNVDSIADKIIEIYHAHKSINIDIALLTNPAFILKNVLLSLQNKSDEAIIKRDSQISGLEEYLFIGGTSSDGRWSVKLNQGIIEKAGLTIEELFVAAENNTFHSHRTKIQSMAEVMYELTGCIDFIEHESDLPMYIVTNTDKHKGSINVLSTGEIREWATSIPGRPSKFVCIMSSIHEAILIPCSACPDLDMYSEMKNEVDLAEVVPEERLACSAFILSID